VLLLRLFSRLWFGSWGGDDPKLPRYKPLNNTKKKKENRP
jgi:hypothetical protein